LLLLLPLQPGKSVLRSRLTSCIYLLLLLLLLPLRVQQVVKEVLRYRPPAPMVPQVAMKPFNLTVSCCSQHFPLCALQ
jgi:cytochrome P450